jgi:hypothetical protein
MDWPKTVNRGWPPDLRSCPVLQGPPGPNGQTVETSALHGRLGLVAVWDDKRNWHYLCHTTEVLETVRARARFNSRPVVVFSLGLYVGPLPLRRAVPGAVFCVQGRLR